ncbi:MAG TPA: YdeI/OmpD-associated family protein [Puia sp.]|nr:YdeI/OmpD-associated family protein [Puia sp.]
MNPKVDAYISRSQKWEKELEKLRAIILDCGLTEELKWGAPCYSYPSAKGQNTNLVIIGELKDCCVISFFKGSLLEDANDILSKPGANTQTARVIRFTNLKEIVKLEPILKVYIYEAIEAERSGIKSILKKNPEPIPEELQKKLDKMPAFKTAFNALTPGRQRAYILYFSQPKQSQTRVSRIEKYVKQILEGKGINDDYVSKKKNK